MKSLKIVVVLLITLVITACTVEDYELEINSMNTYKINGKNQHVFDFSIENDAEIIINIESDYLENVKLINSNNETIRDAAALEYDYDLFVAIVEDLTVGDYKLKVTLKSTDIGEFSLLIYEQKNTTINEDSEFQLSEFHYPGEVITINFTIVEEGFYNFSQRYFWNYIGKLDLYGSSQSRPEFHEELYLYGSKDLYLEPGDYHLELTHWRDFSYGDYYVELSKSSIKVGDTFTNNTVSGTIESLDRMYHFLDINEEGIYLIDMISDFMGGVAIYPINSSAYTSTLRKLENMDEMIFSSVYKENHSLYAKLKAGHYVLVVMGSRGSDNGDYSIELETTDIEEITNITNEGTAYEMLEFGENHNQVSKIYLEITQAGTYLVEYQGSFTQNITMYNILDYNKKYNYYRFDDKNLLTYLEIGDYVIEVDSYYYNENGLNKIVVEHVED